ncbi:hypothetical protein PFC_09360 [Pyrococcus furiosus COM1]|nr:hypothetical protein PFC_09360 [Pyrococcus furiosus COM1]
MKEYVAPLILLPLSFIPILARTFYFWVVLVVIFYLIIPTIIYQLLGITPREVGFRTPNSLRSTELLLVFAFLLGFAGLAIPEMRNYYPIFSYSSALDFALKEILIGVVMFAHEAFFRGFLLFPIAKKSPTIGIIFQDIPYTIIHVGKPTIEIPYSFIAGIIFAKIDLKEESIVPSFLVHWIGSLFFDILCSIT